MLTCDSGPQRSLAGRNCSSIPRVASKRWLGDGIGEKARTVHPRNLNYKMGKSTCGRWMLRLPVKVWNRESSGGCGRSPRQGRRTPVGSWTSGAGRDKRADRWDADRGQRGRACLANRRRSGSRSESVLRTPACEGDQRTRATKGSVPTHQGEFRRRLVAISVCLACFADERTTGLAEVRGAVQRSGIGLLLLQSTRLSRSGGVH